ncbi:polyphosphate kinase 1 [Aureliella helgolandensis]|uniref:Polyphosphate kinase n=1 Tax=Aureliella helgolandensis TaxID=2527968 RepID=A0A518GGY3_9BACT|nr:polyphosphate kinase 1 [Aureliella helgolandensis]QDV27849.1 Polyphosphate kinase [Aureliella helgolandensis]
MAIESQNYINRELSWLAFNQRVLEQAKSTHVPLLERLKFLAISSSNLDEFFMVRVGGLLLQLKAAVASTDPAGMTVRAQLKAVRARTAEMIEGQYNCFLNQLEPALRQEGIERVTLKNASVKHQEAANLVFDEEIFPVLSPMAIHSAEDFPLLANHALYVCAQIATEGSDSHRFVIIPLGKVIPRVITLPAENGFRFAMLEDVVCHFIQSFFTGEQVVSAAAFRITRNADVSIQEDAAADLLHGMKELLQQRKTADCVWLEVDQDAAPEIRKFLQTCLEVTDRETCLAPNPLDLSAFMQFTDLEGYDHLRDPTWTPQKSPQIDPTVSMFTTISEGDLVLNHPYESFEPVVRLIEEAAEDPDVLAIKQTLYRTSRNSPIVNALRKAAERGKYVTALVELKARFDEARNIEWAQELEEAQVQVVYGVKYLKTHSKVCIIVRREPRGIVRYMHFGTGNYNETTARFYSDISYMTCNDELGTDTSAFFNAVTGYSQPQPYNALEAAPIGLRKKLLELIAAEIERKKQGQSASIAAKLNSLVDPQLIEALYQASQAGVNVRLNVRGICCLRPGVPGLSENISVISIVDRILEHARMVYFEHGGDDLMFISSADWMPRNLDKRIELLVPIEHVGSKKRLIGILENYFKDTSHAWELQPDGCYIRRTSPSGRSFRVQEHFYKKACNAIKDAEQKRRTMFEPHQPAAKREEV